MTSSEILDELDPRPEPYRPGPARHRWTFVEMLVTASLGLYAALVLSVEAIALAENPLADLSCDINAVLSCGKVGLSWQASLFGFPNSFLGLIAEPVVITIAVASLGGVRFPRWFMLAAQAVYFAGFLFAYWLFYQSFFVIGALCPWCLLVTVTTTFVFVSLLRVNLLDNNFGLSAGAYRSVSVWLRAGADTMIVIIIIALMLGSIVLKYGSALFA
ncbi:MAG: vitamin K epoxide reductase family protein [bacterium]|nr:vitamin K epoxide reductase family protein [bacterium]